MRDELLIVAAIDSGPFVVRIFLADGPFVFSR